MTETSPRPRFNAARALIALTFLTVLSTAAVPSAMRHQREGKCNELIAVTDRVEEACRKHEADTSLLAIEFAAPDNGHNWSNSSFHRLAETQHYKGWNGPYLESAVALSDNPFGGSVTLRSDWKQATQLGLSLRRSGFGQFMIFDKVPYAAAIFIEQKLEKTEGEALIANWAESGRVRWVRKGGRLLVDFEMNRE